MNIVEFENEKHIVDYLKSCPWDAGKFLYTLIIENKVKEVLGKDTKIIVILDGMNVVSFATYANRDCVKDDSLFPWIGFVYTEEKYRGHRYSEEVIKYILHLAKNDGHNKVYLATDHIGFYEKYGFIYSENRIDIYNEDSRIYIYNL